MQDDFTCGFIGLGLIGGSIAMSIKNILPNSKIIAYARRQETLDTALAAGTIDKGITVIDDSFYHCDIIFLCAPVAANNRLLEQLKPHISDKTIITDVGSVKGAIHQTVERLSLTKQFIGGHPMAGSEKTGFSNANPRLHWCLTIKHTIMLLLQSAMCRI